MLAFIPLTHSTFWGPLAYVLIGGVGVGTLLTLLFLPALYAIWFRVPGSARIKPIDDLAAGKLLAHAAAATPKKETPKSPPQRHTLESRVRRKVPHT